MVGVIKTKSTSFKSNKFDNIKNDEVVNNNNESGKKIIFLESATKQKTIQSFLGKDYVVFATSGHLQELENSNVLNLGVDFDNDFYPSYKTIETKR
jgi:hypothetical protein